MTAHHISHTVQRTGRPRNNHNNHTMSTQPDAPARRLPDIPKTCKAGVVVNEGPDFRVEIQDVDVPEPGKYIPSPPCTQPKHTHTPR